MNTERDPIKAILSAVEEIRALNPVPEGDGSKYVSVSSSGFSSEYTAVDVFFETGCARNGIKSFGELRDYVCKFNPEEAKRKRIEALRAELAQLEGTEASQ